MKRVGIIGGGWAGLSCAYALKRRGMDSTIFEAATRPGGRDGAAFYLLAPELFINYSSHLDFHHPERGLDFDDATVASFVKRELSQNILNYVAGPLISTLFFYGSEETSRWLYLVLAKHMYNTRMSTVRGGMSRLCARLSEGLPLALGRPISAVATSGDAYMIDGGRFSDVVIAVPGDAVLKIAGMETLLDEEDRKFFQECSYQRTVSVTVATERPVDGRCYAVSIPRVENLSAATISFNDYIDPSQASTGNGLLTISGGGLDVSPARLLDDLQKLYWAPSSREQLQQDCEPLKLYEFERAKACRALRATVGSRKEQQPLDPAPARSSNGAAALGAFQI